jgi:hypothetical protein
MADEISKNGVWFDTKHQKVVDSQPEEGVQIVAPGGANYSAVAGDLVPVDTTAGAVTVTLPAAPADRSMVAVKHVTQGGTNAVTVTCGGADVFNKTGGVTTGTLSLANQAFVLQYDAAAAVWTVLADDLPLSALDGRYTKKTGDTMTGRLLVTPGANVDAVDITTNAANANGYALHVIGSGPAVGSAGAENVLVKIEGQNNLLRLDQTVDLAGQTADVLDIVLRSTGDAIFMTHKGGLPSGSGLSPGGDAALNVLIPYYIDATDASGRVGSTINNRTGMRGLFIQSQALTGASAIDVRHASADYGIYMTLQDTALPNSPSGGGIQMLDFSTASTLKFAKYSTPATNEAMFWGNVLNSLTGIDALVFAEAEPGRHHHVRDPTVR